jgi:copper chaperone CopZ
LDYSTKSYKKYSKLICQFSTIKSQSDGEELMQMARSLIYVPSSEAPHGLEKVTEAVSKIPGIFDIEANHLNNLLTIDYDQDRVTLAQIRKTIREASRDQTGLEG